MIKLNPFAGAVEEASRCGPAPAAAARRGAPGPGPSLRDHTIRDKKRIRNIALESILEALKNNNSNDIDGRGEHLTLLKPKDLVSKFPANIPLFVSHNENVDVFENILETSRNRFDYNGKVYNWMKQTASQQTKQTKSQTEQVDGYAFSMHAASMFKERKGKIDPASPCTALYEQVVSSTATVGEEPRAADGGGGGGGAYTPCAPAAARFYRSYLQRSWLRGDLWAALDRKLAEADERTVRRASSLPQEESLKRSRSTARGVGLVVEGVEWRAGSVLLAAAGRPRGALPRHALGAACVVCARLCAPAPGPGGSPPAEARAGDAGPGGSPPAEARAGDAGPDPADDWRMHSASAPLRAAGTGGSSARTARGRLTVYFEPYA